MKKTIGFVTILLTCFIAFSCGKDTLPNETPPIIKKTDEFNLMTYNIYRSGLEPADPKSPKSWEYRKELVHDMLMKYKVDILCAQEDDYDQGEYIINRLGFAKTGVTKYWGDLNGTGQFNGVFYNKNRFTKKDAGHFWFSDTPDKPSSSWGIDPKVICTWISLHDKNTDKEFYVFNTHFAHGGEGAISRKKSAEMLKIKIPEIAGNKPVILTGDMNCLPNHEPITIFNSFLRGADRASSKAPIGPTGTYNNWDLNYNAKDKIDYIFVNDKIDVLTHQTLNDSYNGHFPADHFPILSKMKIK